MDIVANPVSLVVAGCAGLAIACLLWALRLSQTAEGVRKGSHQKTRRIETLLARAESVFSAYPGVIMIWESNTEAPESWGSPKIFGSAAALASILQFAEDQLAQPPAASILDSISDLEARDAHGDNKSLRQCLRQMRDTGAAFSLTIIAPSGQFLEADGRVAGSRRILWLTNATIKELSESNARVRLEQTRQVLASQEGSFLEMLDKSPLPIWRLNGQGQLQWANLAYLQAVDAQSLDQVTGKDVLLDRNIARQAVQSMSSAEPVSRIRQISIGGERRSMQILTFPISGGTGGFAQDVSKEQSWREKYDRHVKAYDETLNHVADAVAIFDADHRLYFHNRAFEELWGLEPSFLLEHPNHGLLLDRLREHGKLPVQSNYTIWRAEELSHYRGHASDEVKEDLWSLPDGRTLRLTRQIHPLNGLILLFRDISSELNLQARYASLLKVQSATLNNLQAITVFGSGGELTLYNQNFQDLWRIDPRTIHPGTDFDTLTQACLPLFPDQSVWAAIKGRVTDPSPEARQKFDGEMNRSDNKIVSFFTQPLPDGDTLIAFKDESDARKNEELLRERANAFEAADRLKTAFVRNVSRELRSPLTTILGYAEMLRKRSDLPEKTSEQVEYISMAAGQLSQLVTNILDLAMIDAGHMQLEITEFDISDVISESIRMAISGAADTEVSIDVKCPSDIGVIQADEKRIRQVLFNLLTNALHFTEAGDNVTIRVEKSEGVLCLKVSDTGCGVPYDKQVQAFSAFDSDHREGAGLGLALVESFVRLHGGWVAMQSEPGKGTSVLCFLPEKSMPEAEKHPESSESDLAAA